MIVKEYENIMKDNVKGCILEGSLILLLDYSIPGNSQP